MSDLIRPEARALLRRWAETLVAVAVAGLGLFWALTGFGVIRWAGWGIVAFGLMLLWGALQRARFALRGDGADLGPGMVQIIESEIRYFGPRGGGFAAIDALVALSLSADGGYWLVEAEDGRILAIPRAAAGAEALFDAFARLPGLDMARLLRILSQEPGARARMIWHRNTRSLLT
jgi:hypothetical protein